MAHGCRFGFPFGGARCVGCGVVRYFPPFQDPEGFRIFFGSKEVFVSFEFASERFSYLLDPKGFRIFWIQKVFVSFLKIWREGCGGKLLHVSIDRNIKQPQLYQLKPRPPLSHTQLQPP
jgi:hypothetical protein